MGAAHLGLLKAGILGFTANAPRKMALNLSSAVHKLTPDQLAALKTDLIAAGIALSIKGDYRAIFKKGRANSKGQLKTLYTALYKADRASLENAIDILTGELR